MWDNSRIFQQFQLSNLYTLIKQFLDEIKLALTSNIPNNVRIQRILVARNTFKYGIKAFKQTIDAMNPVCSFDKGCVIKFNSRDGLVSAKSALQLYPSHAE